MAARVCPGCGADVPAEERSCPRCGATMASSTADTVLGMQVKALDVAALMREALAEQKPGEEIDLPLRRVLEGKTLDGKDAIHNVISENLKIMSWRLGIKRQEAAEQLSRSQAQLKTTPDGKPFLETFTTNVVGLESLSAEAREQVLEQLRSGKTGPIVIRQSAEATKPRTLVIVIAIVLAILALAFWWGLKH
jgi:hypothetical protein